MENDPPENPEAPSALDALVAPAEPVLIWYNNSRVELAKARASAIQSVERGFKNWARTNVTLLPDNSFRLSCAGCDEELSYGNVSRSWGRHSCTAEMKRGQVLQPGTLLHSPSMGGHFKFGGHEATCLLRCALSCFQRVMTFAGAVRAAGASGSSSALKPASAHERPAAAPQARTLSGLVATPQQQLDFTLHLTRALITGCVPLNFIENEDLKSATRVVGITLPSRKVLSTTILDKVFADVQLGTADKLGALSYVDASSDGWRKKYCEQGAGLMNFLALTGSGALFVDAVNCSEQRKDASAIAAQLKAMAIIMTSNQPDRLTGWLLDNTKANWAAMKELQLAFPKWFMRGCIAHGLALAMKDLTTYDAGARQRVASVIDQLWRAFCTRCLSLTCSGKHLRPIT
jgi:Protein of unknown function (DUF 659)